MNTQKFVTSISVNGSRVSIPLPFDPNEVWGKKQRHFVTGSVNGHIIRGSLGSDGSSHFLLLGAAWRRDATINMNVPVTVELTPEGPQQDNLAEDIASALSSDPDSGAFFESLPTFYRKNYIRWIESAKRAETRSARIAEMMLLLKAKKREK
jgi:hypothetical protein